jgi:hypothetical protein
MPEYNTPGDGGHTPRPQPGQSPHQIPPQVPVPVPVPGPAVREAEQPKQQRSGTRVAVVIASLLATVGAVILGFTLTSGHGAKPSTNAAGTHPNVAIDPRTSAAASGAGSPSALPTLSGIPAAPTPDQAHAMASAQAAEKAFNPPSSAPANVPGYSGSAPLNAVSLPPFLKVALPSVQAKDQGAQSLADQSELLLKAWVEAWSTGNTGDARYRALCVEQCRAALDPTVTLWKRANILPAGTIRFFQLAGGLAKANNGSGEVGVCLDESGMQALRDGVSYQNPYPLGQPELLVFGLAYDKAVGHWVATEAYTSPGDSYCTADSGSTS